MERFLLTVTLSLSIVIVTSGPSSTYPQRAYRNPTDALVKFLDYKHKTHWAIWEFRAEGTGYPDSEVYGRIHHYPWPDHHPPPFALIPNIMASMRNWLQDPLAEKDGRVVVVHCKAGKGRSGTVACSYLISEEQWKVEDALARFTSRRMRQGFGNGVSIPSQLRWVQYVDRWTKNGKLYVERQVEIMEVHVWGLRDGVKVAVEGFVDEGRTIKTFHVFTKSERLVVDGTTQLDGTSTPSTSSNDTSNDTANPTKKYSQPSRQPQSDDTESSPSAAAVIFRPSSRIVLPTSDICLDFERRNRATYGWTMVTAVAHVWFNTFFESHGPEKSGKAAPSGVFEIDWDAMDGIKGSSRKGTKAIDRLAVVWRALDPPHGAVTQIVTEPPMGEPVPEGRAADWNGVDATGDDGGDAKFKMKQAGKGKLGLRAESPASAAVSKASSVRSGKERTHGGDGVMDEHESDDELSGVQVHGPDGERHITHPSGAAEEGHTSHKAENAKPSHFPQIGQSRNAKDAEAARIVEQAPSVPQRGPIVEEMSSDGLKRVGLGKIAGIVSGMQSIGTQDLPEGVPEEELDTAKESTIGKVTKDEFVAS